MFSALIFQFIKNDKQLFESLCLNNSTDFHLWNILLDHVEKELSEWSLWIIYQTIKESLFFRNLFENSEKKILLLDILNSYIEEQYKDNRLVLNDPEQSLSSSNAEILIQEELIIFFINNFTSKANLFLELNINMNECEIILLNKISQFLLMIIALNTDKFNELFKIKYVKLMKI